jgi:hypothetical protein
VHAKKKSEGAQAGQEKEQGTRHRFVDKTVGLSAALPQIRP